MEEDKAPTPHPFSKIAKAKTVCVGPPPPIALVEWNMVKTPDDVRKWHLKWTPWFDAAAIEGFVKYAYPQLLETQKAEEAAKKTK
jgi:hypothetical protein